jgi:hydrogenase maturation protease
MDTFMTDKRILVLGVGNILFTDEGIGVRCIEQMQEKYKFSDNVTLMDGGTLGTKLMGPIIESDYLIVCDAVLCDDKPGSVYRLMGEDLRKSLAFRDSMHQTDLVDTLGMCEIVGNRPEAVVIGMEPFDYDSMALELSPTAVSSMPVMIDSVIQEIESAGGTCTPN